MYTSVQVYNHSIHIPVYVIYTYTLVLCFSDHAYHKQLNKSTTDGDTYTFLSTVETLQYLIHTDRCRFQSCCGGRGLDWGWGGVGVSEEVGATSYPMDSHLEYTYRSKCNPSPLLDDHTTCFQYTQKQSP